MADTLTDFILTPAKPFAAGVVLFGAVWGFFKGVESILTDATKLRIAVGLLGVETAPKVQSWPETFAKVFDHAFGDKHLSWKCFFRSAMISTTMVLGVLVYFRYWDYWLPVLPVFIIVFCVFPDYLTLLKTRYTLAGIIRCKAVLARIILILADAYLTTLFASVALRSGSILLSQSEYWHFYRGADYIDSILIGMQIAGHDLWGSLTMTTATPGYFSLGVLKEATKAGRFLALYPAFFTSIWLLLYTTSSSFIKFARRFDIGLQAFNRICDIERKPLSAIGLVAAVLAALICWAWATVSRVV